MKSRMISFFIATLSIVIMLSVTGGWGQSSALAQEPEQATQVTVQPQPGAMEEVVAMRARNRKVFRYNEAPRVVDGQEIERRTMQVSLASLHYQDAAGQWQDVDTQPVDIGSEYRVAKTNAPLRLPKVGADPLIIQAAKETISVRLVGASGAQASLAAAPGATAANQVAFANLLPQTDIAYQVEPDGVREFITLKGPGHPTVFTFEVATALKMSLEDGNIVFHNQAGEAVGQFTRPWLTGPGAPPVTRWGALSLDGDWVTMTLPDLSGLAYPIVVDPTYDVSLTGSANDGYAITTWNVWNTTDVRVNLGKGLAGETYNTALRWDTATGIPQGTQITSAYVQLRADNNWSATTTAVTIKAARNSDNDVIDTYTEWGSTWRTTASVGWTIPAWTAMSTYTSPNIATVIQEAVNHSGFNGAFVLFIDDNGSTAGATRSAYSYDGNATHAPQLEVNYEVRTVRLYTYFTDKDNATAEYGLTGSDVQLIQVDYKEDKGSGFGSYTSQNVTFLSTGPVSANCPNYYPWARWKADISTSGSQNVQWRVRIPANLTAKDLSSTACTAHTTIEAHAFWSYRGDPFPTGTSAIDTHMGLGIWP